MHKIRVLSPHLHIWVFACYCGEEKAKWFTLKLLEIFVPQIHNYSLNSEWLSFTLDIVFYNGLCLLSYWCAFPLYHLVGFWSWNFLLNWAWVKPTYDHITVGEERDKKICYHALLFKKDNYELYWISSPPILLSEFLKQNPFVCTLNTRHLNLKGMTDHMHIEEI